MEDMKSFDEPMPSVGIFWYDPEDHKLFGVRKKELTPVMVEEAAEKGVPFINYPDTVPQDKYSGSIAWEKDIFIVHVANWAEPIQDELSALLEREFALPCFEVVYE